MALSVPVRASHVDTVRAQFRIFDRPDGLRLEEETPLGIFGGLAGGLPSIVWPFYHLLVGSMVSGSHGPCGLAFTTNRLVLDFLPASETNLLPLGPVVSGRFGRMDELRDFFPHDKNMDSSSKARCLDNPGMETAARLMRFVWMKLQSLDRLNEFDLGKRLHENIGVIEVRLDGKLYKTLDLGYWLAHAESRLAAVEG